MATVIFTRTAHIQRRYQLLVISPLYYKFHTPYSIFHILTLNLKPQTSNPTPIMSQIIYNVTCNMHQSIETIWLEWIREHIPLVLGTGLFMDARLTRVLVEEQDGSSTFSIQYKAIDRKALDLYYEEHAPQLRKESFDKFGEQVLSFRTELELIDEYRVKSK